MSVNHSTCFQSQSISRLVSVAFINTVSCHQCITMKAPSALYHCITNCKHGCKHDCSCADTKDEMTKDDVNINRIVMHSNHVYM